MVVVLMSPRYSWTSTYSSRQNLESLVDIQALVGKEILSARFSGHHNDGVLYQRTSAED